MNTSFFILILICLGVQRLSELWISKRHEKWLKERGAIEYGQTHYIWVVGLMVLFFLCLPFEFFKMKTQIPSIWPLLLVLLLLTQGLRFWSMSSLGKRWTTRIWILPLAPRVAKGPYKYFKHPNYLAVVLELILIPWIFGCYFTLFTFTTLYLLWLRVRLKEENQALQCCPIL